MSDRNKNISILGAGLAGSLLSSMLVKRGFKVSVFEKRADPRESFIEAGKSINLALSHRGIRALKAADIFDKIEKSLIPMKGRMIHDLNGNLTFQPYGKSGQHINSISRSNLNTTLIESAADRGVKFHFNTKVASVNIENSSFIANEVEYSPDVLIGADGAFSVLRKSFLTQDRFDYQQQFISHGYKEISMPAKDGDFAMEPNYLHIWPRGNFMLIALPNNDKTFTCTLFFPFEGNLSFESVIGNKDALALFEQYFPDALKLIPDLSKQFIANPTSSLVVIRCAPWNYKNCLLIGDAAHAIVPFYGQGMIAAFEDCRLLAEMGDKLDFQWSKVFRDFSKKRKKDADAIADLALRNFIEMRDEVGDESFLRRKKTDMAMHDKFDEKWLPLYSMVTFSDIPYHQAQILGNLQQQALKVAQDSNTLDDLDGIMMNYIELKKSTTQIEN